MEKNTNQDFSIKSKFIQEESNVPDDTQNTQAANALADPKPKKLIIPVRFSGEPLPPGSFPVMTTESNRIIPARFSCPPTAQDIPHVEAAQPKPKPIIPVWFEGEPPAASQPDAVMVKVPVEDTAPAVPSIIAAAVPVPTTVAEDYAIRPMATPNNSISLRNERLAFELRSKLDRHINNEENIDEQQMSETEERNGETQLITNIGDKRIRFTLCNFIMIPTARKVIYDKCNKIYQVVEFDVQIVDCFQSFPLAIETSKLQTLSSFITTTIPECRVSPDAPKAATHLSDHFRKKMKFLPILRQYRYSGWEKINGVPVFLHDGLVQKQTGELCVASGNTLMEIPNVSSCEAARMGSKVLELSYNLGKIIPLYLFTHLGLLTTLFTEAGHQPQFALFINGSTGTFKTAVSKVVFTVFNATKPEISATFKDTSASMEYNLEAYKDCVLLVDDFHPATTSREKSEMDALLERVVRFVGDGIGKGRSNANLQQQHKFEPKGVVAITGEDVGGTQSSLFRCFMLEVDKNTFRQEVLTELQRNPLAWSTHLAHFVRYVQLHYGQIVHDISTSMPMLRDKYNPCFKAKRLLNCASMMLCTAKIVLNYMIAVSAIKPAEADGILLQWEGLIIAELQLSESNSVQADPAVRFVYALYKLHYSNRLMLAHSKQQYAENPACYIGYEEGDLWWLEPDETYKKVMGFWQDLKNSFMFSTSVIYKALDAKQLIRTQTEKSSGREKKNFLYKTTLNGRPRFLVLHKNLISNVLEQSDI